MLGWESPPKRHDGPVRPPIFSRQLFFRRQSPCIIEYLTLVPLRAQSPYTTAFEATESQFQYSQDNKYHGVPDVPVANKEHAALCPPRRRDCPLPCCTKRRHAPRRRCHYENNDDNENTDSTRLQQLITASYSWSPRLVPRCWCLGAPVQSLRQARRLPHHRRGAQTGPCPEARRWRGSWQSKRPRERME